MLLRARVQIWSGVILLLSSISESTYYYVSCLERQSGGYEILDRLMISLLDIWQYYLGNKRNSKLHPI